MEKSRGQCATLAKALTRGNSVFNAVSFSRAFSAIFWRKLCWCTSSVFHVLWRLVGDVLFSFWPLMAISNFDMQ
jgi:hypothetical protein